jgi:MMP 1-O-methyltransferase
MLLTEALHASDRAKGWLSAGEQSLLYELARGVAPGGTIVELGSWNGRSTIMLAAGSLSGPTAKVHAVDLFANVGETRDAYAPHLEGDDPNYWPLFERNIREAGVESIVVPLRGSTLDVAREWSGPPIDLLFIDANHSYEAVRADFLEWGRHCRPGAFCAFHDYFNLGDPGVRQFVDPLIAAGVVTDVEYVDSIAYGRLKVTDRVEIERRLKRQSWNPLAFLRRDKGRDPKFKFALSQGWTSLVNGDRRMATRNGIQSIGFKPWRADGWKLLACTWLKPLKTGR